MPSAWAKALSVHGLPESPSHDEERSLRSPPLSGIPPQRLAAIQRAQDRLISRVATSDALRWEHVERELERGDAERKLIQSRIEEIRDARANADTLRRQASEVRSTVVAVAGTLDAMTIEQRRWVLDQLGVRVFANGTRWQIAHAGQVF